MLVYKFKSLGGASPEDRNTKMQYILDIIENSRLFCSPYDKLNDPMEGYFEAAADNRSEFKQLSSMIDGIVRNHSRFRICSLSADCKSHLMWAHYANGFRGIAIELNVRKRVNHIEEVEYSDGRNLADYDPSVGEAGLEDLARKILLTKYKDWKYEKEVRIFKKIGDDKECYHDLQEFPTAVYFGVNIDPIEKETISSMCVARGIRIFEMQLTGYKIGFRENKTGYKGEVLPFSRKP